MKDTDNWRTPKWLFDGLHQIFAFRTDAAADANSALLPDFFSAGGPRDALTHAWTEIAQGPFFINCPFSELRDDSKPWIARKAEAGRDGATVVAVLPTRSDTDWFCDVVANATAVIALNGRIQFDERDGSPSSGPREGNSIAIFGPVSKHQVVQVRAMLARNGYPRTFEIGVSLDDSRPIDKSDAQRKPRRRRRSSAPQRKPTQADFTARQGEMFNA